MFQKKSGEIFEAAVLQEGALKLSDQEFADHRLQESKKQKYQEAETLRKQYQFQNINYLDSELSTSEIAKQNILGVTMLLSASPSNKHYWRDNKNKPIQLSLTDCQNILKLISVRDTKLYFIEGEIRNLIEATNDLKILETFKIPELWQNQEAIYQPPKEELVTSSATTSPPPATTVGLKHR